MKKKVSNGIVGVLMMIVFLSILGFALSRCAPQQKIAGSEYIDDYKIRDSSIFFIGTEVIVDSLIIPAGAVGKMREMCPGELGINMLVFDFQTQNGQEVSLRFVRKGWIEKTPKEISKKFILWDQAEFYESRKYRSKMTHKKLIVPNGGESALLFIQ